MPAMPKLFTSIIPLEKFFPLYGRLQKNITDSIAFVADSIFFRGVSTMLGFGGKQIRKHNAIVNNIATAIEQSPDVAIILQQTATTNLRYAGAAVAASMFFQPIRTFIPVTSTMLMVMENGTLTLWCAWLIVSNSLYNMALAKSLMPYVPLPSKDDSMPLSNSDAQQKLMANVANLALYFGLLMMASGANLATASLPELLQTPGFLLQAIAYGYALAGMQYATHGIAANDASAVLNNNKIYFIGIGAALIYTVKKTTALVEDYAHIAPNFFLEDAIFNLVWQQSIMLVMLQEPTEDYFRYPRDLVQQFITQRFKNFLKDLKETASASNVMSAINKKLNSADAKYILSLQPVQMVVDVHHAELTLALEWIRWVRAHHADTMANWLIERLPEWEMLDQFRVLTKIIKQQNWEQTCDLVEGHLKEIATRREIGEGMTRLIGPIEAVPHIANGEVKQDGAETLLMQTTDPVVPQRRFSESKTNLFAAPPVIPSLAAGNPDEFIDVSVHGKSVGFQLTT